MLEFAIENETLANMQIRCIIVQYVLAPEFEIKSWRAIDNLGSEIEMNLEEIKHFLEYAEMEICK
jgi:hypothetical protein